MNREVFVKGLEKFKIVSRLLGQNLENLDGYGCPSIQDLLVAEDGKNVSWICSSCTFGHKSRFHCAKRKANVYGERALQHSDLYIWYLCYVFAGATTLLFLT